MWKLSLRELVVQAFAAQVVGTEIHAPCSMAPRVYESGSFAFLHVNLDPLLIPTTKVMPQTVSLPTRRGESQSSDPSGNLSFIDAKASRSPPWPPLLTC